MIDTAPLDDWLRRQVDEGLLGAGQYAIGHGGRVIASGHAGAADEHSRFVIFSATKTIVATALLPLLERSQLELTAPVAAYIPEFGEQGKHRVTVLQLLTMQGGFPQAPIGPARWGTSEGRREAFARWTLDWPAGAATEYHPVTAHWVIAELLETISGVPYATAVHDTVSGPAGAARLLGQPARPPVPVRVIGQRPDDAAVLAFFGSADLVPEASVTPDALLALNDPAAQAAAIPGGGGIASASDIALTYQAMLHNPGGMLPPAWLADATGVIRNASINRSDGVAANRTITGVVAGSDGFAEFRWFPRASRAFGHHGAGGQLCWLDPSSGLSFSFLHDTLDQDVVAEHRRCRKVNELSLASMA